MLLLQVRRGSISGTGSPPFLGATNTNIKAPPAAAAAGGGGVVGGTSSASGGGAKAKENELQHVFEAVRSRRRHGSLRISGTNIARVINKFEDNTTSG